MYGSLVVRGDEQVRAKYKLQGCNKVREQCGILEFSEILWDMILVLLLEVVMEGGAAR